MAGKTKMWLLTAASLVLLGATLFCTAMSMLGWDFTRLSTVRYETNTYELREPFQNISIVSDTADLVFLPSENEVGAVVCYEQENAKHSVTVKDGTLVIAVEDTRKWFEHIGISFDSPKITVSLPKGEYGELSVRTDTGDVEIPGDFRFEGMDIAGSTGDLTSFAPVSDLVRIRTSTGKIRVEDAAAGTLSLTTSTGDIHVSDVLCEGDVSLEVSTGRTNLSDLVCRNLLSGGSTGDIRLHRVIAAESFSIRRSTGDVRFEASDAAEIFVETDTGEVTGTLLSRKLFLAESDTGDISVPRTSDGGSCEIITNTGDIRLEILG